MEIFVMIVIAVMIVGFFGLIGFGLYTLMRQEQKDMLWQKSEQVGVPTKNKEEEYPEYVNDSLNAADLCEIVTTKTKDYKTGQERFNARLYDYGKVYLLPRVLGAIEHIVNSSKTGVTEILMTTVSSRRHGMDYISGIDLYVDGDSRSVVFIPDGDGKPTDETYSGQYVELELDGIISNWMVNSVVGENEDTGEKVYGYVPAQFESLDEHKQFNLTWGAPPTAAVIDGLRKRGFTVKSKISGYASERYLHPNPLMYRYIIEFCNNDGDTEDNNNSQD